MAINLRTRPLILREAILAQPVPTPETIPAGAQLGLAADAHVAALVAADAGAGVRRVELVAAVLAVVVVAVGVAASSAAGVDVGAGGGGVR